MSRPAFKVSVDIDAPPEKVFAILCDVERWPDWTRSMTSVQLLERSLFDVGAKARVVQPKLRPAIWEVTDIERNRNFTWVTGAPGVHMKAEHLVEAAAAGSRVSLSIEISGILAPVIAWVYGSLIEQYVGIEAQGLKRHSETSATAPA